MFCRLQEADLGFNLIVDRRKDRWNAVKAVLLRISVSAVIIFLKIDDCDNFEFS